MPLDTTSNPITGGQTFDSFGPSELNKKVIRERVAVTASASNISLYQTLPPRCELLWATLKSASTFTLGTQTGVGGSAASATATVTADRFALYVSTATTFPTATQNGSAGVVLIGPTGTVSNGATRDGLGRYTATAFVNTSTNPYYLYVIPYSTAAGSWAQNINPATAATQTTAGFRFSTGTANVDVQVVYQQHIADSPDQ